MKKYVVKSGYQTDTSWIPETYEVVTEDWKYGDCKALFWGKDSEQVAKEYAHHMNLREQSKEWEKKKQDVMTEVCLRSTELAKQRAEKIVHWKIQDDGVACKSAEIVTRFNVRIEDVTCEDCKRVYQSKLANYCGLVDWRKSEPRPLPIIHFRPTGIKDGVICGARLIGYPSQVWTSCIEDVNCEDCKQFWFHDGPKMAKELVSHSNEKKIQFREFL